MPRARLIINPIAGTSRKKGLDTKVVSRLEKAGWEVEPVFTQCHGDATRLARESVDVGFDTVIAAGGDGTVNETAVALCDTGVTLGIIPCGSGNGLARHLNIPIDIEEGLRVIEGNHIKDIDYGTLNGHHFFCTCGMGFDARVSERFARHKSRGLTTYVRSMLEEFHDFKPAEYTLKINGETITEKAFVVAICNASQYGNNAYIAPDATIDDGMFDITVIQDANAFRTALAGLDMLTGMINHNTIIHSFRVPSTTIEVSVEGPVHIDGEPMRLNAPYNIENHHNGLRVFAPAKQPTFHPVITPVQAFMRDLRLHIKHLIKP